VAPILVAARYATRARAEAALDALRRAPAPIRDAAVVLRDARGRLELQQTAQLAPGEGIVAGGTAGLVLGVVAGAPVAAALVGMAAAGGLAARDTGIPDERLRELGRSLGPGEAVLCALADDADVERLRAGLAPYDGELIVSEVGRAPEP
jgi:uncharacterized membrane protein